MHLPVGPGPACTQGEQPDKKTAPVLSVGGGFDDNVGRFGGAVEAFGRHIVALLQQSIYILWVWII